MSIRTDTFKNLTDDIGAVMAAKTGKPAPIPIPDWATVMQGVYGVGESIPANKVTSTPGSLTTLHESPQLFMPLNTMVDLTEGSDGFLYGLRNQNLLAGAIQRIDKTTRRVVAAITVLPGTSGLTTGWNAAPSDIFMDDNNFYVVCGNGNWIYKVSRTTNTIVSVWNENTITKRRVRMDWANGFIYVLEGSTATNSFFTRINISDFTAVRTQWTGKGIAQDFDLSTDGSNVYVISNSGLYQVAASALDTPINAQVTGTGNTGFYIIKYIDDGSGVWVYGNTSPQQRVYPATLAATPLNTATNAISLTTAGTHRIYANNGMLILRDSSGYFNRIVSSTYVGAWVRVPNLVYGWGHTRFVMSADGSIYGTSTGDYGISNEWLPGQGLRLVRALLTPTWQMDAVNLFIAPALAVERFPTRLDKALLHQRRVGVAVVDINAATLSDFSSQITNLIGFTDNYLYNLINDPTNGMIVQAYNTDNMTLVNSYTMGFGNDTDGTNPISVNYSRVYVCKNVSTGVCYILGAFYSNWYGETQFDIVAFTDGLTGVQTKNSSVDINGGSTGYSNIPVGNSAVSDGGFIYFEDINNNGSIIAVPISLAQGVTYINIPYNNWNPPRFYAPFIDDINHVIGICPTDNSSGNFFDYTTINSITAAIIATQFSQLQVRDFNNGYFIYATNNIDKDSLNRRVFTGSVLNAYDTKMDHSFAEKGPL